LFGEVDEDWDEEAKGDERSSGGGEIADLLLDWTDDEKLIDLTGEERFEARESG
jgi:hypothetical protein